MSAGARGGARGGRLVALGALLLASASAGAATFQARVNATHIGLDDQLQLTITLTGASPKGEITMPPLAGLEVVAGPSTSTQISFVNGAISQSRAYTLILRPTGVGQATIGAARVELADGERTTEPITVEVVPGSVLPPRVPPLDPLEEMLRRDPFEDFFRRHAAPAATPEVRIEAEASRRQLFVGEPLVVTFYLLTQAPLRGLDLAEAPSFSGFWVEELPRDDTPAGQTVTRGGEQFERFPVLQQLLFPTRAGTLTVPSLTFRLALPRRIGFFVDPGLAGTGIVTRASEPLAITVLPIPASEEAYGGAVGRFRLTASVDRQEVELGEAVQVRVAVEGRGNLKWVDRAPQLAVVGAKVYPPRMSDTLRATTGGISGQRAWEFVVVPEAAGMLEIPALSFPYFDPEQRAVQRAETPPIRVTVRAPLALASQVATSPLPSGSLALRADLLDSRAKVEPAPTLVLTVAALSLAAHALLLAFPHVLRRRGGAGGERRRSTRALLAELRRARSPGVSKESAAATIERVLLEVFGDLERPEEGKNPLREQARELVREARFVRYGAQLGEYGEKLDELARRTQELVRRAW